MNKLVMNLIQILHQIILLQAIILLVGIQVGVHHLAVIQPLVLVHLLLLLGGHPLIKFLIKMFKFCSINNLKVNLFKLKFIKDRIDVRYKIMSLYLIEKKNLIYDNYNKYIINKYQYTNIFLFLIYKNVFILNFCFMLNCFKLFCKCIRIFYIFIFNK